MPRVIDRGSRTIGLKNYPVAGSTFDEILASIRGNQLVPGGLAGYTSFNFRAEQRKTNAFFGRVTVDAQVSIEYTVEVTLPLLQSKALSEQVARAWNLYQQRLYQHELNHARLYFAAVDRMLQVQDPSRFNPIFEESKRLSEGYDNATQHGIREGCVLGTGPFTVQDFGDWLNQALRRLRSF